jgi:hypothetical protein
MSFNGFVPPTSNFFCLPNCWTDITAEIDNLAELKVIEYVLRHTWGFHEFGANPQKVITIDEFMRGRQRHDGSRMDRGTGLSKQSVIDGTKKAVDHGYLICKVDDADKARVKKAYALKMFMDESDVKILDIQESKNGCQESRHPGSTSLTPEVQNLDTRGPESRQRSEKDTLETNSRKTLKKNTREPGTANADTDAGFIPPPPDEKNKNNEVAPGQKERAAALKAVIVAKRGYDLDQRGPHINETSCITQLVREHTDADIIDTLQYLHDRDFKWSKPDNRHKIGAQVLRDEIARVLVQFQDDPTLRKPPKPSSRPTTARAEPPPGGPLPKTVMSEEQARILAIQAVEQAASKQHTITAEAVALEDGRWVIRVDWQTPPFVKPAIIPSETRWSQLFLDICDIWKEEKRKKRVSYA